MNGIAFGEETFVAVDDYGQIHSSLDGIVWTTTSSPFPARLNAITYASGKFIAVGSSGAIVALENGTWTAHGSGTTQTLASITYGNGWFVAVGNRGIITRSSDGVTWFPQNSGTISDQFSVGYGGGVFVAVGRDANALVSVDGAAWEPHPLPVPGTPLGNYGLIYAYGKFYVTMARVSAPINAYTATSTNGVDWSGDATTPYPTASASGMGIVALVSGGFSGFSEATLLPSSLSTSKNGVNWVYQTKPSGAVLRSIAYGNDVFVAVGSNGAVVRSTNGSSWSRNISVEPDFTMTAGAYGGGTYVMVGGRTIVTSPDFVMFSRVDGLVPPLGFTGVTYGNGKFVAVGPSGTILRSTNGIAWTPSNSGGSVGFSAIAFGGGKFVAVGTQDGTIRISQDGVLWNAVFSGTGSALVGLTYGNGKFIAVGASGTILTSPDGLAWTPQYNDDLTYLQSVIFGNGQFIAVGAAGTVLWSTDGSIWTKLDSGITADLRTITFGGGLFVAASGGRSTVPYPDLFSSPDGEHWVRRNDGTSTGLTGVSFLNNTFMSFGPAGLILQSDPLGPIYLDASRNLVTSEFEILINGGEMGRKYRLQMCNDLGSRFWTDAASFTQTQYVTKIVLPMQPSSGPSFYRAMAP
jgi:hypothetical protein